MTLPEAECAFFYAVLAQLAPDMRPVFAERVAQRLGAHPDPGPGDVDRAVRAALAGLWTPPEDEELQRVGRWNSNAPGFERISKQASTCPGPAQRRFLGRYPSQKDRFHRHNMHTVAT
jgi:hypothetical protein